MKINHRSLETIRQSRTTVKSSVREDNVLNNIKDSVNLGEEVSSHNFLSTSKDISSLKNINKVQKMEDLKDCYKPAAEWSGTLVLPKKGERRPDGGVYIKLTNTPKQFENLKNKTLWLGWQEGTKLEQDMKEQAVDINFSEMAMKRKNEEGAVLPERLDGLSKVSPLETLAGARETDNMEVLLKNVKVVSDKETGMALKIGEEPVQIDGSEQALIQVVSTAGKDNRTLKVRHYNKKSGKFDGPEEVIDIKEPDNYAHNILTFKDIEKSPVNSKGWYIYGDRNEDGKFIVKALEPRELMMVKPMDTRGDLKSAKNFITSESWKDTPEKQGTFSSTLLEPAGINEGNVSSDFREGNKYLLLQLFGGIGGEGGYKHFMGQVTGHFSFGSAEVVKDPFTGDPKFDITYDQIYVQVPYGVVATSCKWHSFMGNVSHGWANNRPQSDIVVRSPEITKEFDISGKKVSFMGVLNGELERMMARYRSGDGEGARKVSLTESCVQDSSQSLYSAIRNFKKLTKNDKEFMQRIKDNPGSEESIAFEKLDKTLHSLEKAVKPLRLARSDWKAFADHKPIPSGFGPISTAVRGLLSWKTVMPRRGNDNIAKKFLDSGSGLWVLRSNQMGGDLGQNFPEAPSHLLSNQ